ncbi:MAG TPA: hypothetical protein VF377_08730 [Acidimicrobiia bacterium]
MSRTSRVIEGLWSLKEEGLITEFVRFPGSPDRYLITMGRNQMYFTASEVEAMLLGVSLAKKSSGA